MIHPETANLLHFLLKMLAEKGEEKTFAYIRKEILKNDKKKGYVKFQIQMKM